MTDQPKPDPSNGTPDPDDPGKQPRQDDGVAPSDATTPIDPSAVLPPGPPGGFTLPPAGGQTGGAAPEPPPAPPGPSYSLPNYEQSPYDQPGSGSTPTQPEPQGYDAGYGSYSSPGVPPVSSTPPSAPTSGGYGTPPTTPTSGAYGTPPADPTSGAYGGPSAAPTSGGYDPAAGGYGTPPAAPTSGGYGTPPAAPTSGGYGTPPGYGQPAAGGYDPTSGAGGYGQPPAGAYDPSSGAGGYPPPVPDPSGYGPPPTGGYGQQPGYPQTPGYPAGGPAYPPGGPAYPPQGPGFGSAAGAAAPYGVDPYGMPVPAQPDQLAQFSRIAGIASIPLGLFGCCCTPLALLGLAAGIAGLVMGFITKKNVAQSGGLKAGEKEATVGMITGGIGVAVAILLFVITAVSFGLGGISGEF